MLRVYDFVKVVDYSKYYCFYNIACCTHSIPHLVYTSTYNVIFGHDEIRNGNESLPYLPMEQVIIVYILTKSSFV